MPLNPDRAEERLVPMVDVDAKELLRLLDLADEPNER